LTNRASCRIHGLSSRSSASFPRSFPLNLFIPSPTSSPFLEQFVHLSICPPPSRPLPRVRQTAFCSPYPLSVLPFSYFACCRFRSLFSWLIILFAESFVETAEDRFISIPSSLDYPPPRNLLLTARISGYPSLFGIKELVLSDDRVYFWGMRELASDTHRSYVCEHLLDPPFGSSNSQASANLGF